MGHPLVYDSSRTVTFGLGKSQSPTVLVIFLMQKLRPRLRAISRSSRKSHDFSK
jgi:hypothetical protein